MGLEHKRTSTVELFFSKELGLKIEDAHLLLKSFTALFSLRNHNKPNQAISFDNL
jgi:hypothetical protein